MSTPCIRWLEEIRRADVAIVGGKNASLGEMTAHLRAAGVRVPDGFATTADGFRKHLADNRLADRIAQRLRILDVDDIASLQRAGAEIRDWILDAPLPQELEVQVRAAYAALCAKSGQEDVATAIRSSATAEDLPTASFAGQQETFLNVRGADEVIRSIVRSFASLYTDRAIAYRVHSGFAEADIALSTCVQRLVRADLACAGVAFTLEPESGFRDVVVVNACWGFGENLVQGTVDPDEFHLYKPNVASRKPTMLRRRLGAKQSRLVLDPGQPGIRADVPDAAMRRRFCVDDDRLSELARQAIAIEAHYGVPMDIEWAIDGQDEQLYILQARPETVHSQTASTLERYCLEQQGEVLCTGLAIGRKIGAGKAVRIERVEDMNLLQHGDVLVARSTTPDWEPVMKRAAAIVTERGGRTCHAAIVARELGVPAVVGCGEGMQRLPLGQEVTVSCAGGDEGLVYAGRLGFRRQDIPAGALAAIPVNLMLNVANPDLAYALSMLPSAGVGLARLEFLIATRIGVHPCALLGYGDLDADTRAKIDGKTAGYPSPVEFYVQRLGEGIATLAAAFSPRPVIVRLSDFKTNEYAQLLGGERYEPREENPMLGFRGASRYASAKFADAFALECRAIRHVREAMGLDNVWVMVPFVRTPGEARGVVDALAAQGLRRGERGLRLVMMCEIPSNALDAGAFLELFDGFSIGSNDLTQLTLGIDRDSGTVPTPFDERNAAVVRLMSMAIRECRARGRYVGICGQAPSDHPDLAVWLAREGIESISLNADSLIETHLALAAALEQPVGDTELNQDAKQVLHDGGEQSAAEHRVEDAKPDRSGP